VVVGILLFAMALFLPKLRNIRGVAEKLSCQNNFKRLLIAMNEFACQASNESSKQRFPIGCSGLGDQPEDRLSWMVTLLPYLDQGNMYNRVQLDKGYVGNKALLDVPLKTFLCASFTTENKPSPLSNYYAMAGIGLDAPLRPEGAAGNGVMGFDRSCTFEMIKDGLSNTILLMESHSNLGPWAQGGCSNLRGFDPVDLPLAGDKRPFFEHVGKSIVVGMCDGTVHSLRSDCNPEVLSALITIAGGETIDWYSIQEYRPRP